MDRTKGLLLAALGAVALLIVILVWRNRQPPVLPLDDEHAAFISAAACNDCHGPEGILARSKNHPVGQDCMRCHGYP